MFSPALSRRVLFRNLTRRFAARAQASAPKQHATSESSSFKSPPPYLNIKLPDLSAPPPEAEVHIPFTPDFWESSRAKANAAPPEEPHVPKVIVVAGDSARADSTHISASIREHVTVDDESASVPEASNLRTLFNDVADDLMLPKDLNAFKYSKGRLPLDGDFEEALSETGMSKYHNRTLDDDQVRGIWVIVGLFAGSWLAGGLLKKNSNVFTLRSGLPQMLGLRRRPTSLALRLLHSSVPTANYVGPPDPVSNIRPVLYNDLSSTNSESPQHPYSLNEFRNDSDTLEYQWKLQRQQLDAFNDAFWRDTNTRFKVAKTAVESGLPPHATAEERQEHLGEFYKNWVLQEALRQEEYDSEWRRRSMQEIRLAARVSYQKLKARFAT